MALSTPGLTWGALHDQPNFGFNTSTKYRWRSAAAGKVNLLPRPFDACLSQQLDPRDCTLSVRCTVNQTSGH
jgi:hypothetical protein